MFDRNCTRGLGRSLGLILGLAAGSAVAAEAQRFDIEAGALDRALDRFAEIADVQIVYPAGQIGERSTEGFDAELEPRAALDRLLAGTGLEYRFTDPDTVVVQVAGGGGQLGTIDVSAAVGARYSADGTATGIGEGYGLSPLESPVSTSAVDEQLLEEQDARRLRETVRNMPGVNFSGTYLNNYDNFKVRGFEVGRTGGGYLRNGKGSVHLQQPSFFPIQRVEVLKGPASILNGSVAPGGVINIRTFQPAETPVARVRGGVDSFGQYNASANLGGPLSDSVSYRLVAGYLHGDTFKDKVQETEKSLYGTMRWSLSDATALTATFETTDRRDVIDDGLVSTSASDPLDAARELPRSRFLGEPVDSEYDNDNITLDLTTRLGQWDADLTYNWSNNRRDVKQVRPNGTFAGPTPFAGDGRSVRRFTNTFVGDRTWQTLAAEFRRSFDTGPVEHRLGIGADYRLTKLEGRPNAFTNGVATIDLFEPSYGADVPFARADKRDPEYSHLYGVDLQDVMRFGESWITLAGVRYDKEVNRDEFADGDDEETDAWSPRLGLVYRATPDWSLYGSYAESFEPIPGVDRNGDRWDPAKGEQIELGSKLNVLHDATLSASVFEVRKTNTLIDDPDDPSFQIQSGERRSRGLEVELAGRVTERLDMRVGYTHLETEIVDADSNEGNEFGQTPNDSFNLWTGYALEPDLRVGGGVFYTGERWVDDANNIEFEPYTVVDVFARYDISDRTDVQFNVDNVFDERYFIDANTFQGGIQYGEPMTASINVTHAF